MKNFLYLLLLLVLVSLRVHAQDAARVALSPAAKRVVFLGDSITYAGQYTADIETYFLTRYPWRHIEFINAGLPSETVSGLSEPNHAGGKFPRPVLSERLGRVLEKTHPDVIFACYGMNDGIYLPFDDARFKAFQTGIEQLHAAATAVGAKIIHITPPYYDGEKTKNLAYTATLARYTQWLIGQRANGWAVIDINGPMTTYITEKRKTDPKFAFAKDGVHPDDLGHWIIAQQVLLGIGALDVKNTTDASQMASVTAQGNEILTLAQSREDLMKDAWLSDIGHKRPGMPQVPLGEASSKATRIGAQIQALLPAIPRLAPLQFVEGKAPIRVACVGDSITQGSGAARGQSYPSQLQAMLGAEWNVGNFGVSGRTLLRKGDFPYWKEKAFVNAQEFKPDAVVIMLGTNDTKPQNWAHSDEFATDFKDLVKTFEALASKPHIYVCRPTPVPEPGNYGINETNLLLEIPIIDQLARSESLGVIDMHAALVSRPDLLPDRVHPSTDGAALMAATALRAITELEPNQTASAQ